MSQVKVKKTKDRNVKKNPPTPASQPAAEQSSPGASKPLMCKVHGPVNSTVLNTTERTEYSVAMHDIVHLCPHCYIAKLAELMGAEIENPKPIYEGAGS